AWERCLVAAPAGDASSRASNAAQNATRRAPKRDNMTPPACGWLRIAAGGHPAAAGERGAGLQDQEPIARVEGVGSAGHRLDGGGAVGGGGRRGVGEWRGGGGGG